MGTSTAGRLAALAVGLGLAGPASGQEVRNITNSPANENSVAWSPDGSSLLVSSDRSGSYDIYSVSLDGSTEAALVLATEGDSWVNDWSTDGRISFVSMVDENADIWVGAADGSESASVHPTETDDWFPSFAPSGALVFNTNRYGRSSEIVMLPAGDSDLLRLTFDDHYDASATVSPDGEWLLYHSRRDGNYDLYVRPVDGQGERRLTTHEADDSYASWAPDSRRVVFRSARDGHDELYVLDLETEVLTRLTHGPEGENYADWSPDGRWIAFVTDRDGNDEIYVIEAPEG